MSAVPAPAARQEIPALLYLISYDRLCCLLHHTQERLGLWAPHQTPPLPLPRPWCPIAEARSAPGSTTHPSATSSTPLASTLLAAQHTWQTTGTGGLLSSLRCYVKPSIEGPRDARATSDPRYVRRRSPTLQQPIPRARVSDPYDPEAMRGPPVTRKSHVSKVRPSTANSPLMDSTSSAVFLTRAIKECPNVRELYDVCQQHAAQFNHLHVAAALVRLSKIADKDERPDLEDQRPVRRGVNSLGRQLMGEMLESLSRSFVGSVDVYSARELSNVLWSWGRLKYSPSAEGVNDVLAQFSKGSVMSSAMTIHLNAAAFGLAMIVAHAPKTKGPDQELLSSFLRKLTLRAVKLLHSCSVTQASTLCWSLTTMNFKDEDFLAAVCPFMERNLQRLTPKDLTSVISCLAVFNYRADSLIRKLAQRAVSRPFVYEMDGTQLALTALALSILTEEDPKPLFDALCAAILRQLPACSTDALSKMLQAMAQAQYHDPTAMNYIYQEFIKKLKGSRGEHLQRVATALVALGYKEQHLLTPIAREAGEKVVGTGDLHVVKTLSALVKGGVHELMLLRPFFDELKRRSTRVGTTSGPTRMDGDVLGLCLWSMAVAKYSDKELLENVSQMVLRESAYVSGPSIANVLWACSKMRSAPPGLYHGAALRILALAPTLNALDCCQLVWAFAHRPPGALAEERSAELLKDEELSGGFPSRSVTPSAAEEAPLLAENHILAPVLECLMHQAQKLIVRQLTQSGHQVEVMDESGDGVQLTPEPAGGPAAHHREPPHLANEVGESHDEMTSWVKAAGGAPQDSNQQHKGGLTSGSGLAAGDQVWDDQGAIAQTGSSNMILIRATGSSDMIMVGAQEHVLADLHKSRMDLDQCASTPIEQEDLPDGGVAALSDHHLEAKLAHSPGLLVHGPHLTFTPFGLVHLTTNLRGAGASLPPALVGLISQLALTMLEEFSLQELELLLWGLGKSHHPLKGELARRSREARTTGVP